EKHSVCILYTMTSNINVLSKAGEEKLDEFMGKLSLGEFDSDQHVAEEILTIIEEIICIEDFKSIRYGTFFLYIFQIISEEFTLLKNSSTETNKSNSHSTGNAVTNSEDSKNIDFEELRTNVIDVLVEQKAELEQCQEMIAIQGESKIHSDEIIMTCGFCPTVLGFLRKAAAKRRFHVIVAESSPVYDGHKMAKMLSSANIQTTVIQDCAIFSLMSRVNKVIIGCKAVLCNGGIKAFLGAASLACAAKILFRSQMIEDVKDFDSTDFVLQNQNKLQSLNGANVSVTKFDYVRPQDITIFITNNRGISPSYVYRQVMELYHHSSDVI
ncbi:Translation initiation factor eIF-2B subunit beta, partial [Armadillidium nasatum]